MTGADVEEADESERLSLPHRIQPRQTHVLAYRNAPASCTTGRCSGMRVAANGSCSSV